MANAEGFMQSGLAWDQRGLSSVLGTAKDPNGLPIKFPSILPEPLQHATLPPCRCYMVGSREPAATMHR